MFYLLTLILFFGHEVVEARELIRLSVAQSYSDNISKNKVEQLKGHFIDSQLELSLESSKLRTSSVLNLQNRYYSNNIYAQNFDSTIVSAETMTDLAFNDGLAIFFRPHGERFQGRGIDFDSNSVLGREELYYITSFQFGVTKKLIVRNFDLYLGADLEVAKKRYDTLSNDENGNLFLDDQNGFSQRLWTILNNRSGNEFRVDFTHSMTDYLERRSRFTEGTLDNSKRNPFQLLEVWGVKASYIREVDYIDLQFLVESSSQDDLVFGALDSKSLLFGLSLKLNFADFILVEPQLVISRRKYESFVADLISNPSSHEKRLDTARTFSIKSRIPFFKFFITLDYSNTKNESNYQLEGYYEHVYSAGLSLSF